MGFRLIITVDEKQWRLKSLTEDEFFEKIVAGRDMTGIVYLRTRDLPPPALTEMAFCEMAWPNGACAKSDPESWSPAG